MKEKNIPLLKEASVSAPPNPPSLPLTHAYSHRHTGTPPIFLLAYSPLAMGILSGKYFGDDRGPTDARLNLFRGRYSEGESRYSLSNAATKLAYSFQLWKDL
uniref:Uncharacterized protein n=1 Tax=Chenopodium quinoa TaxID=63459 RepID=A0A803N8U5_CHEQI